VRADQQGVEHSCAFAAQALPDEARFALKPADQVEIEANQPTAHVHQRRVVDPILGAPMPLHVYEPGAWGPHAANDLRGPESSGWSAPGTVAPALK
jgi:hypothetical protein